jgi:two-component system, sensor histidine kinase PdtaS
MTASKLVGGSLDPRSPKRATGAHPAPPHQAVTLDLALAVIASSNVPLLLLDDNLRVVVASLSFCDTFGIDPATVQRRHLAQLGAGEWNVPQLSSLLRVAACGLAEVRNYEMELRCEGELVRNLSIYAQKVAYADQENVRLLLTISDVTAVRSAEKLKDEMLRQNAVMLQELHHRVANSLQIIASVLMQSARNVRSDETRMHLHDAHHRVMSVAALQGQLAASNLSDVELNPYFTTLCEHIGASMIRDHGQLSLEVTADNCITTADISVSLGLIVTELVINALKHAFPGNQSGRIVVVYRARTPDWALSVSDDGVGMCSNHESKVPGLGTSIVQALAQQLQARVEITDANPGTKVSIIRAPVAPSTSHPITKLKT